MRVLNAGCLLLVAFALVIAVAVVRSRRVMAREQREDSARRAAGDRAFTDFRTGRDFAATVHARLLETPDEWAARTGNTAPARLIARLPEETP